jgi:hypothetical protein
MDAMAWLALWLVFGLWAAREISGIATMPGGTPALAVLYAAASVAGLAMMIRAAVRRRHPKTLYPPLVLSLSGLAIVALLLHQKNAPPDWIGTVVAAGSFLALSACAFSAGAFVAWRRREADRDRRSREDQEWERRRLLEQSSPGSLQDIVAELENPPIEDDADLLPPRPLKR